MKYFAVIVVLAQLAFSQISAQVLRSSCGCGSPGLVSPVLAPPCAAPAPVYSAPPVYAAPQQVYAQQPVYQVQSSDVAGSLADTLSLLTVSSLLAEKLPLGYPPAAVGGCGCGSVYGAGYYF